MKRYDLVVIGARPAGTPAAIVMRRVSRIRPVTKGGIVVHNMFAPHPHRVDYDKNSWVLFTDPQVAQAGFGADERDAGIRDAGGRYARIGVGAFGGEDALYYWRSLS